MKRRPAITRGSLLARICDALSESPESLAAILDVPLDEFLSLQHLQPGQLVEVNRSEMWTLLDAHVTQRIAGLFAVREELSRALRRARKAQAARRAKVLNR